MYRTPSSNSWRGYIVPADELHVPGLGNVEFTMALPLSWELQPCCQRLQISFTANNLTSLYNQPGYFLPSLEWTLCTPELRLFKCYGFAGEGTELEDIQAVNGSWSISVLQCIKSVEDMVETEIGAYGDADIGASESPRYSRQNVFEHMRHLISPTLGQHFTNPCLIEGTVDTDTSWLGTLATMAVPAGASISYRFMYHASEPSNDALLTILFYNSLEMTELYDAGSCSDMMSSLLQHPESASTLPLSIVNAFAGCSVEDMGGLPTYICEGGRTIAEAQTLHVTVNTCYHADASKLSYFLEFMDYTGDCTPALAKPIQAAMTNSLTLGSDSASLLKLYALTAYIIAARW